MDISLKPETEQFVQVLLAAGTYPSMDALLEDAVALLKRRRDAWDAFIDEGIADIEAGRWVTGEEAFAELRTTCTTPKRQSA